MLVKELKTGAIGCATAVMLAGCSTMSAGPVSIDGLRQVAGTSLVGAKGKTPADQLKIDETAAGLCSAGVWTRSQCVRHAAETGAGG